MPAASVFLLGGIAMGVLTVLLFLGKVRGGDGIEALALVVTVMGLTLGTSGVDEMNGGVEHRRTSLAHLVWPVGLLPLSVWLIYVGTRCPGNPGTSGLGLPVVWVAAVYLTPPVLLAVFILTLRWRPDHGWLRAAVAVGLGCGFLVACGWGFVLFSFAVMGECLA